MREGCTPRTGGALEVRGGARSLAQAAVRCRLSLHWRTLVQYAAGCVRAPGPLSMPRRVHSSARQPLRPRQLGPSCSWRRQHRTLAPARGERLPLQRHHGLHASCTLEQLSRAVAGGYSLGWDCASGYRAGGVLSAWTNRQRAPTCKAAPAARSSPAAGSRQQKARTQRRWPAPEADMCECV